jgi:hypothetical protein
LSRRSPSAWSLPHAMARCGIVVPNFHIYIYIQCINANLDHAISVNRDTHLRCTEPSTSPSAPNSPLCNRAAIAPPGRKIMSNATSILSISHC